jgi:hypothetical protein
MHKAPVWVVTSLAILASATLAAAQGPDRHERGGPAGSAPGGPHGGPAASPPLNRGAGPSVPPAQHREMAPPRARAPEAPAARTPQRAEERSSRPTERSRTIEQRGAAERERAVEQRRAAEQQRAKERNQAAEQQRAAERQRATERQRQLDERRAAGPDTRTAKYEEMRQARAKLSVEQRTRIRSALHVDRARITNVQFAPRVGTRIPRNLRLLAVPATVFAIFPYYREYRYVVVDDTICIVDPNTYEIVDIFDEVPYAPGSRPEVAQLSLTDHERTIVLDSITPDFPEARLRLRLALGAEVPVNIELYEFPPIVLDNVPTLRIASSSHRIRSCSSTQTIAASRSSSTARDSACTPGYSAICVSRSA